MDAVTLPPLDGSHAVATTSTPSNRNLSLTDVASFAGDCATLLLAQHGADDDTAQQAAAMFRELQGAILSVPVSIAEATA